MNDGTHCQTCICDAASPRAVESAKRVALFKIAKDSMMYYLVTPPTAHAEILRWWQATRNARPGRPHNLTVDLVAHENDIEIVFRYPPPPPKSHRRPRTPRG